MTVLKDCYPEPTLEGQLKHLSDELDELVLAHASYHNYPSNKNRADMLFEALDVILCCKTFIKMEFSPKEIEAGVNYTNSKNFVRHYLKQED